MRILGISAFYHDSAAALIEDGRIVAAAQEERFSRKKHDARFPVHAIRYCLGADGLGSVHRVVFYDKPFLKFERLLETYLAFAPHGFNSFRMSIPLWLREKLFLKDLLKQELPELVSTVQEATARDVRPFRELISRNHTNWAIVAAASVRHARRHSRYGTNTTRNGFHDIARPSHAPACTGRFNRSARHAAVTTSVSGQAT